MHVDFQEVRLDQPIHATVPVHLVGAEDSPGIREGGVLSQVSRDVNVEALPMEIPEHLDLDVSRMQMNDTLRLSDLSAPEGVKLLDDPEETVLATVAMPALEVEPEPVEVEGEEGEAAEGEEGEAAEGAEGESAGGETPTASPAAPRGKLRFLKRGRTRPRRSTCSSSASGTRVASTRRTATTSAGWSSTSSPAVTAALPGQVLRAARRGARRRSRGSRC